MFLFRGRKLNAKRYDVNRWNLLVLLRRLLVHDNYSSLRSLGTRFVNLIKDLWNEKEEL